MTVKRALILVSIIMIVAMLAACVRSASTPPTNIVTPPTNTPVGGAASEAGGKAPAGQNQGQGQTPGAENTGGAAEGSQAQPEATNEVLQQLAQFVTQTAAAAQLVGMNPLGTPYPQAGTPGAAVETQAAGGSTTETGGSQAAPSVEATQPAGSTETGGETGGQSGGQTGQTTEATQPASQPSAEQPTQSTSETGGQGTSEQPTQSTTTTGGQQQPTAQPAQQTSSQYNLPVPTPTPGIPSSYTLQPGEFVYCIARRFNVNPTELLAINGLSTSSIVRGGMVLRIPQTGNKFPDGRSLKSHPTTYTVQAGENIYMVACKFGDVSPDQIAYANRLSAPYNLTVGQTLYIP